MLQSSAVPVFCADFALSVVRSDFAYLTGERDSFSLSGVRVVSIARLIDGQRSVADILALHDDGESDVHALAALDQLCEDGLIMPMPVGASRAESAFWQGALGSRYAASASPRFKPASVAVVSLMGDVVLAAVTRALELQGIECSPSAEHLIVLVDDYLKLERVSLGRPAPRPEGRWLLVKPGGTSPWIGPLLGEEGGPCLECLFHWLRTNRPVETLIRRAGGVVTTVGEPVRAMIPASLEVACNLAAVTAARSLMLQGRDDLLKARLLEVDLTTFETSTHPVLRRPQCPGCGDSGLMSRNGFAPLRLSPIAKGPGEDGGFRRVTPRETFESYSHLVSRITGAVTHVARMPDRDTPIRSVYSSAHRIAPWGAPLRHQRLRRDCAGKGRTPEQAQTSALCEALERYSAVYQADEATVRGSLRSLGPRAVHPDALQHFSRAQRLASEGQGVVEPHRWVGRDVDEDLEIEWTPAWSLTRDEQRFVPLSYCYSETPPGPEQSFCRYNPNGAAAGNCLEEAILHGLFELIERDAVAIWWYNRLRRPEIDLATFGDPYLLDLKADYARLGWKLWALDLTHDLKVPVCVGLAWDELGDRFCIGFGCHVSQHVAVQRALTELNQLFAPASSRPAPWDLARMDSRGFLFPDPAAAPVPPPHPALAVANDMAAEIRQLTAAVARVGHELLVVNKTRPDVGLPVAHVIVPGLRHFWPRFAPGRLYDVPCQLGQVRRALTEVELNPVSLFL